MKSLIKAVAGALVVAAPLVSFAQSNQPLTRAQMREELIQLEKAGYNPATVDDADYPADIQAAEARVAAQHAGAQAAATSVGGVAGGTSRSGGPASAADTKSLYFGQ
ncbi:conserved exported hypothetical protein [Paraburkholderia piptadeniae]|uniref:Purine nucleoside phosphorylase n=1 Tax=Paraburkholderia piptadeniae TaxID=1701573 RepID=A0A1N7SUN7_9BURK|nr:DUF4148 domain-containing protein [Paraburkholderia piptadeniae]SIT51170.1 conserved exported hypothetical protein [Paraburkholderia piptadeniae]